LSAPKKYRYDAGATVRLIVDPARLSLRAR
jgi:hypothetical protein